MGFFIRLKKMFPFPSLVFSYASRHKTNSYAYGFACHACTSNCILPLPLVTDWPDRWRSTLETDWRHLLRRQLGCQTLKLLLLLLLAMMMTGNEGRQSQSHRTSSRRWWADFGSTWICDVTTTSIGKNNRNYNYNYYNKRFVHIHISEEAEAQILSRVQKGEFAEID